MALKVRPKAPEVVFQAIDDGQKLRKLIFLKTKLVSEYENLLIVFDFLENDGVYFVATA